MENNKINSKGIKSNVTPNRRYLINITIFLVPEDPRSLLEVSLLIKSQETSIGMDVDVDQKLNDEENSEKAQISVQASENHTIKKAAVNGKESRRYRILRRPTAYKSIALLPGVPDFSEMNSSDSSSSSNFDASSDSECETSGRDLIGRKIKQICQDGN